MDFSRIKSLQEKNQNSIISVKPGMLVEIHEKLEGENNRIWKFKGLVLKVKKPQHADGTFTVRGEVAGVMVEKIYPLSFPKFKKIILLDEYKTRRSKLYYMRDKIGKAAKMKSKITPALRESDILKNK